MFGRTPTTNASTDDEQDDFLSHSPNRKQSRLVKTDVLVNIPPDIRTPTVVQSLAQNKVSSTAISAVMHTIITAVQEDSSKLSLNISLLKPKRIT